MRFMAILKANELTETGAPPKPELLAAMGKYNEEMIKAGVFVDGGGLKPSSTGARVRFSGDKRTVLDGPFAETKELIAGYWIIQVQSKAEAIDWMKRCPLPFGEGHDAEIELRPFFESSDFANDCSDSPTQAAHH